MMRGYEPARPAVAPNDAAYAGVPAESAQDEFQNIRETAVEVISAVQLTAQQRRSLEIRLIKLFKKRVILKFTVDPALLGGIRVIADNTVIDDSIKRKLYDIKNQITKGVFQTE